MAEKKQWFWTPSPGRIAHWFSGCVPSKNIALNQYKILGIRWRAGKDYLLDYEKLKNEGGAEQPQGAANV